MEDNKMKRTFALILISVLLVSALGLVACNPGKRDDADGWVEGKTNVVYYTWASESEMAMYQDLVDNFEKDNPDIHIVMKKAGTDYYEDLMTMLTGPNSPDIVQMKPGDIEQFLRAGAIISLQDYIDKSIADGKITEDMIWEYNDGYRYNPETKIRGNHEDDIYSLIKDFSCDFVLNYNKKLVTNTMKTSADFTYPKDSQGYPSQETPMTWNQYMQFAKGMSMSSVSGTCLDNEPYQQLLEWIQQGGGSLWSADHKTVTNIKTDPAVRAAFDYYRMLRDEATKSPIFNDNDTSLSTVKYSTRLSIASTTQVGPAQLKERQTATIFYGRWAAGSYNVDSTGNCEVGFAAPPVPNGLKVDDTTKYAGVTAMVGTSISAKSKNKDAAWKFIEYYFTEGQKMYAEQSFNIPGNRQIANTVFLNSENISEKDKETNRFFYDLALNHGFVIEFNKYLSQASVEDVLKAQLSAYFAKSRKGEFNNADWEKCLDTIQSQLQARLDRETR